jgi:hypothetical protein
LIYIHYLLSYCPIASRPPPPHSILIIRLSQTEQTGKMKFLALLALLPAVLSIPSPAPQPEAYNPFPPTFDTTSTHSNNPISHGNLNSRRHLSALHDQETIIVSGKISHKRGMKVRKVKRQAGSGSTCKPVTATATATATGSSIASSASSAVSSSSKSTAPSTTSKAQGTSAPTSSSAKASTTSSAPKPAATNFTVDPDGNGPFKGQATCEFLFSSFHFSSTNRR